MTGIEGIKVSTTGVLNFNFFWLRIRSNFIGITQLEHFYCSVTLSNIMNEIIRLVASRTNWI